MQIKTNRRKKRINNARWYREDLPEFMEAIDAEFMTKYLNMPRKERRNWCKIHRVPFVVMPKISDKMNDRKWDKAHPEKIPQIEIEVTPKIARQWLRA